MVYSTSLESHVARAAGDTNQSLQDFEELNGGLESLSNRLFELLDRRSTPWSLTSISKPFQIAETLQS